MYLERVSLLILKPRLWSANPGLKMMWWVSVTHSVPSGLSTRLSQPPDVEAVVSLEATERAVPATFVHRSEASAPDGHAPAGEPVGRVGEDRVHASRGHEAHELHAIRPVDDRPRLAVRLEVPQLHTAILGRSGTAL